MPSKSLIRFLLHVFEFYEGGDDILKQIEEKEGDALSVQVLSAVGKEKVMNVKVLQDWKVLMIMIKQL